MAQRALHTCNRAGCRSLTRERFCEQHQKGADQRPTSHARGYDWSWAQASKYYRRANPLCVNCLLYGKTRESRCVDHIIPKACCPQFDREPDNWAALCIPCHSHKTTKEPTTGWTPDPARIVVCGLPGTGKSTWARERGAPYFDADELHLSGVDAIVSARDRWIKGHSEGPCTLIVASTVTASTLASVLRGIVKHLTTVHVDRIRT